MRAAMRHIIAWLIVPLMILGVSFAVARCAPPSVALETTINPPRSMTIAATPSIETTAASLEATTSLRTPTPVAKPEPSPKPTPAPTPSDPTPPALSVVRGARTVTATGYCSCAACCGKSDGITASGARAAWGTIAAPKTYAFGSRFTISGLSGVFTVQDRGGAISGNRIDIWFPSHAEALRWGRRTVTLTPVN